MRARGVYAAMAISRHMELSAPGAVERAWVAVCDSLRRQAASVGGVIVTPSLRITERLSLVRDVVHVRIDAVAVCAGEE